jgi:hypothetical protein
MMAHPLRAPRRRLVVLTGLGAALLTVAMSAPAQAVVRPTVTVTNDANHDGVFTSSETVPSKAKFPYSVDYRVTIDTTGTPIGAFVSSLTDNTTPNISTCSLIGTTIPTNSSASCTYTVSFASAAAAPVVNTVTLVYNAGGLDTVSGSSTVTFEQKQKCNSGNGNGSDPITFNVGDHCFGGDPGNSFNAGNKGGDEIPTTVPQGGVPNPGGNNVP